MSYDVYAGQHSFHLSWNYNEKIILPALGEEGLTQFHGKTCLEAAEGIAKIIEHLNAKLQQFHTRDAIKHGPLGNGGVAEFHNAFGNSTYGHVTEGVLRLTEIMIACYRQPTDTFEIH